MITRKTATPAGIFCIVQDILRRDRSETYPADLVEDFFFHRTHAEHTARQKTDNFEVTLDQIYEALFESFQHEVTRDDIGHIKNLEIESELQWCVPIPENIQKVHSLLDQGERVVLISDMYLPSDIIRSMLEVCDERVAQCPIYVSCEVGSSKHTGKLFRHVADEEKVSFSNWYHVGDNWHADYRKPRSMGIKSTLYARSALNELEWSYLKEQVLFYQLYIGTSRLYRIHHPDANDRQVIGASLVGPLLYPYADSILRDAKQKGLERLYFLARDGQILRKIAQTINEQRNLNLDLRYLYCARQTCFLASLFCVNEKTLARILIQDVKHSIELIAGRLGVSSEEMFSLLPDNIKDKIKDVSMPYGRKIRLKIERFLFSDERIKEYILQNAKQYRKMFASYLQQEGFFEQQSLGIVDMGWMGNMQDCLMKVATDTKQNLTIHGYYFAMTEITAGTSGQNCKHAMSLGLVNYWDIPVNALELITSANHGTTSGYFEDVSGRIIPKLGPGEHLVQWGIEELQDAALWFCQHYQEAAKQINDFGISPSSVSHALVERLRFPSKWVADVLGTIPFSVEQNDQRLMEAAPVFSLSQTIQYVFCRRKKTRWEFTSWEMGTLARSPKYVRTVFRIYKILKNAPKMLKPLKKPLKAVRFLVGLPERLLQRKVIKPLEVFFSNRKGKTKTTETMVNVVALPTKQTNKYPKRDVA